MPDSPWLIGAATVRERLSNRQPAPSQPAVVVFGHRALGLFSVSTSIQNENRLAPTVHNGQRSPGDSRYETLRQFPILGFYRCHACSRAQDPDDLKRGVARISLMNGDVSVRRGDSGEWVAGVINAPLLTDDRVAT